MVCLSVISIRQGFRAVEPKIVGCDDDNGGGIGGLCQADIASNFHQEVPDSNTGRTVAYR